MTDCQILRQEPLLCAVMSKGEYGIIMHKPRAKSCILPCKNSTTCDHLKIYDSQDYNPTIIYDASCLAKEVGMGRESQRFSNIIIVSDLLHAANHTSCSEAFYSHTYSDLFNINKEAA